MVDHGEFFKRQELQCKHCGECEMDRAFMDKLDHLRYCFGKPIILNSGYRCPEYNNKISTTGLNGPHTTGKAIDIRVYGEHAWEILKFAIILEFKGIGVSQKGSYNSRFIHIDKLKHDGRPWVWSY